MDWLEQELKQALARQEPDPGFEARVRSRQVRVMPFARQRWVAVAAMLVVGIAVGEGYRQYRGQVAKQQVMTAMRMAGSQLNRVQVQLSRGTGQ
jgi:hypothetical protein